MNTNKLLEEILDSPEALEIGVITKSQVLEIHKLIVDRSSDTSKLDFLSHLFSNCDYEKLILFDKSKRRQFALAMTQCWILTRIIQNDPSIPFSFKNIYISPLATIVLTNYELVIDEVAVIEQITKKRVTNLIYPKPSKNQIEYQNRFVNWPFLNNIQEFPTFAIKTLLLVAHATSLQTFLLEFNRISGIESIDDGILYLYEQGVLTIDVPKSDLLTLFTIDELKKFALSHGIKDYPNRKLELIALIKQRVDHKYINIKVNDFISDSRNGYHNTQFMKPNIPNLKTFQEYVRDETNRLMLYLEEIACIENNQRTIIRPVLKQNRPNHRPGDIYQSYSQTDNEKKAFASKDFIERISTRDMKTIEAFWDNECSMILERVKESNPKTFPFSAAISQIIDYWKSIDVLQSYKDEIASPLYENPTFRTLE